jgi:hypothetical protein
MCGESSGSSDEGEVGREEGGEGVRVSLPACAPCSEKSKARLGYRPRAVGL